MQALLIMTSVFFFKFKSSVESSVQDSTSHWLVLKHGLKIYYHQDSLGKFQIFLRILDVIF